VVFLVAFRSLVVLAAVAFLVVLAAAAGAGVGTLVGRYADG